MIAVCNSSGAYIYNCTENAADDRIKRTEENKYARGGLDYDEQGNSRKFDGMCGCLFLVPELIQTLIRMGIEAIYINANGSYTKYDKTKLQDVSNAYREICKRRFA